MSGRDMTEGALAMAPETVAPVPMGNSHAVVPNALAAYGLLIGELVAFSGAGTPLVRFPGPGPGAGAGIAARTLVELQAAHIGQSVALMFDGGDFMLPVVMGIVRDGDPWMQGNLPAVVEVVADGKRLVVAAQEQLVLRCGQASITLTREGKVLIQGAYLSSRSTGVNRIRGGSVQLN